MGPDFLDSFTIYNRNTNSFTQSINTQTFYFLLMFNVFLMLLFVFRPRVTTNIRKTRKKAAEIDPKELHEMGGMDGMLSSDYMMLIEATWSTPKLASAPAQWAKPASFVSINMPSRPSLELIAEQPLQSCRPKIVQCYISSLAASTVMPMVPHSHPCQAHPAQPASQPQQTQTQTLPLHHHLHLH